MAKESTPPPNLHGINPIRNSSKRFPGGRKLALILSAVVFVLVSSAYYPGQVFYGSTELTHNSHQTAIAGHKDNEIDCDLFNGTWVRDLGGPIYTNMTCPTIPDSKNCAKYGKQMDYVNWRWKPQGCDMARFQPQLFLNIVQGKTLAFAGDSIGRNQMESLLCLLSQVSKQCLVPRHAMKNNNAHITYHH
ncbi:protein ALTERED XYLOGLUCAN 4-like [Triticum aestivum]|uniref:protein ALTERED XYLOGLUCAN 4-like n=1 Tax=Triticum aestivum TaxID=4565 RepID=UPI001D019902|nr:protein ALTERED XYLOGLUCAN 4-like [Triticum aestivum]